MHSMLDIAASIAPSAEHERSAQTPRLAGSVPAGAIELAAARSPTLIVILDSDLRIHWANAAAAQALGSAPDALRGKRWSELARDALECETGMQRALCGEIVEIEIEVPGGASGSSHFCVHCEPLRGQVGEICGVLLYAHDVSRAVSAQTALSRAEAQFRALAENAQDIVEILDAEGRIVFANPAVKRAMGYEPAEILGRSAFDYLHPDDLERVRKRFSTAIVADAATPREALEVRVLHKNGSWRWLEAVSTNALADQAIQGLIVHSRDVTARKQAELALSESEERYRAVSEMTPGYVAEFAVDEHGARRLIWAGRGFYETYGVDMEAFNRTPWRQLFHQDSHAAAEKLHAAVLAGEQAEAELEVVRADGTSRWIRTVQRPIRDSSGRITRILSVVHDHTARHLAEQALRHSEFRYRTIVDATPGYLYEAELEPDGRVQVTWASEGFADLVGCSVEEFNRAGWRAFAIQEEVAAGNAHVERVQRGDNVQAEYQLRRPDGGLRWIALATRPFVEARSGRRKILGFVSDITSRKHAEAALRTQAIILETMREGVALFGIDAVVRVTNPAFDRMIGVERGGLVGSSVLDVETEPSFTLEQVQSDDMWQRALYKPLIADITVGRRNGSRFVAEVVGVPLELSGEKHWLMVMQDVTERRQLEREIIEVSTREQQRIGHDLHDGLGQELTGVALMLRGLAAQLAPDDAQARASVDEIVVLVNQAIQTARSLAQGLSPLGLERGGLTAALRQLAQRAREQYGLIVQFRTRMRASLRINQPTAHHLYRIAQEAVANAVRHGRARKVRIALEVDPHRGRLTIQDDGVGLAAATAAPPQGMGLRIMAYRSRMIGASLDVENCREGGVRVRCTFPQPDATNAGRSGATESR
jgi:hypothetical protein